MTLPVLPASIASAPLSLLGSLAGEPVKAAAQVGLDAVSSWMVDGAETMLHEVVKVISTVTTPSLSLSWFSVSYWQMSALAMLLTLPFLFAAAVQAVIQTNVAILIRAAFVDLPIAAIAVTLTAPLITLLLAATDQMCSLVSGEGTTTGASFLTLTATQLSGAGNGFLIAVVAVMILLAGMTLLIELIMRSAAIYIVVLFLPLGFAAMVWPARRVWVKRMLETLVALILSKFAMVAILSLAVAGLASLSTTPAPLTTALTAMALIVLATLSPWALLRLLPFTELAAGAALMLHQDARQRMPPRKDRSKASTAGDVAAGLTVDPVTDVGGALRDFVSGNSADGFGLGAGSGGRLLRRGGGGELPPGADGPAGGWPGSGPDAGGSGGGGAPASILPADRDGAQMAAGAVGAVGAGGVARAARAAAGATPSSAERSGAVSPTGADPSAGAAASLGVRPSPASSPDSFEPSGRQLGSASGGRPPAPAANPGDALTAAASGGALTGGALAEGSLTGGESTRGTLAGEGTPGGGMPGALDPTETVGGPVDHQAPIFANDGLIDLTGTGPGFIVLPGAGPSADDDRAESSDA